MKKTFNINLGGMIFHIDDDAFSKLEAYLSALRQQFSTTSGGDEILSDVETRMAELFKERTSTAKEVVNIKDVNEVIAIIGEPQDFWQEETGGESNYQSNMSYEKRVMRDVDNRVLGGVAGGLAAYFNIDVIWVRLLFVALMFAGFGVLLYIILWLVVPAAKTTAEKLQMRGKPVTLSNIENFVKDEAQAVGANMSKLGGKVEDYGRKSPNLIAQFFSAVFHIIGLIFRFIFKVIGFFFLGIGFIVLMSIVVSLFTGIHVNEYHYSLYEFADLLQVMSVEGNIYNGVMLGTSLLIIGPLFLLIYFGIRLLFDVDALNKGVRNGLLLTTLLGLVILGLSAGRLANQFDDSKTVSKDQIISAPRGMIEVSLATDSINTRADFRNHDDFWNLYDGRSYFTDVELDIRRSTREESYLQTNVTARGSNLQEARRNTGNINHPIQVDSNSIKAANYFTIKEGSYYRAHKIRMVLYLAEGDTVFLKPGSENLIYDIRNVENYWDSDMVGHHWTMTNQGLHCTDCPDTEYIEDRWEENESFEKDSPAGGEPEVIIRDGKIIIREAYHAGESANRELALLYSPYESAFVI